MIEKPGWGHIVENLDCGMSDRQPSKVIEQGSDINEAALLVGQWKMVWRNGRWRPARKSQ